MTVTGPDTPLIRKRPAESSLHWLAEELPAWTHDGLLTDDQARRIRARYDFAAIELDRRAGPGQEVWVRLEPQGASWAPTLSRASRGADKPGAVWLRGRREGRGGRPVYGLEEFYVRQGRGPEIERAVRTHRILAEFAVAADGTGTLTALIVDGKRIE